MTHAVKIERKKWSRGQVETRRANLPPCLIGMEACIGAHHLVASLMLGHEQRLVLLVTNFGICSEPRSMGNAIASWRERPPISVALLQSSSERGVQAATADALGW